MCKVALFIYPEHTQLSEESIVFIVIT